VRVLGIDPGTVVTGWGVVEYDGRSLAYLHSGVLAVGRGDLAPRLGAIYEGIRGVITQFSPDVLSLERNFLAVNVQSAFRLGEARGVAMAAAAASDVVLHEYTPATIKKSVVGHGRADKAAVQVAVARLLKISAALRADEADALAAAACHALRQPYETKLAAALRRSDVAAAIARRR